MTKFCAILTCSLAVLAGIPQNLCVAQSGAIEAARPRFGSPAVPAPPAAASSAASVTTQAYSLPEQSGASMGVVTDPSAPLGIGDIVVFSIQEDRDLPVRLRVTDSGELDIPYAGRVRAVNRTCDAVASEAKRLLEAKYYNHATVKLGIDQRAIGHSLGKVYITGLVRTPGQQDLFPGEKPTVSAVVIKSGGFMQFADKARVLLTRKGRDGTPENRKIDIGAVLQKGRTELDVEVQDGDSIYVPQKVINF